MEGFAALLDALVYTTSRNRKLALIADYLRRAPDPDRGWALAGLTGGLDFPAVKSSTIRALMMERIDPVLWTLSRDFVGDTAETASLLWPAPDQAPSPPSLSEAVALLSAMSRKSAPGDLAALLVRQRILAAAQPGKDRARVILPIRARQAIARNPVPRYPARLR